MNPGVGWDGGTHFLMRTLSLFQASLSRSLGVVPFPTVFGAGRAFNGVPPEPSNLVYAKDFSSFFRSLSQNPRNPSLLASLDSMLARAHLLDSATSVLVLRGLSQCRKLGRATSILANLKKRGNIPDLFLYSLVLECLVPHGPIRDVELVWNEATGATSSRPINISDYVPHLCRHGGGTLEIERVYRRASASRYNLGYQAYVSLIGALCCKDSPNPALARDVLREMEERGFEADGLTYFTLFRSFCRLGNVSEADSILRHIVERGKCELDILIYGNFLHGLCRSNKLREARKLFDKMVKRDFGRTTSCIPVLKPGRRVIFQLSPSSMVSEAMAFGAYFRSLCVANKVDAAEKLVEESMRKNVVHESCLYRSFIEALFSVGRVDDAVKFFEIERRKGYVSTRELAVSMIVGLCKVGSVEDGFRLLQEMVRGGFVPTAGIWNCIIEAYWKCGRAQEAIGIFVGMREGTSYGCARPDASTYAVMVHGFLGKEEVKEAVFLLEEMVKENIPASLALYSAVFRALWTSKKLEDAHKFLSRMIESGILVSYVGYVLLFDSVSTYNGDGFF